jgi:hypothetical protein
MRWGRHDGGIRVRGFIADGSFDCGLCGAGSKEPVRGAVESVVRIRYEFGWIFWTSAG